MFSVLRSMLAAGMRDQAKRTGEDEGRATNGASVQHTVAKRCNTCGGSRSCVVCHGQRRIYQGGEETWCPNCQGGGQCVRCHGSGTI